MCCANWSSTLSTLISFSLWMCNIANDERRSSVIVFLELNQSGVFITKSWLRTTKILKIETIAKNFKMFCSLQVHARAYIRIGRYAPASDQ